jgi:transforming growth factor-beta-induced protein
VKRLLGLFIVVLLMTASLVPALAQDDAPSPTGFDTLLAAIDAAGLSETIATGGPFTIFAPTNAAFDTLLANLEMSAEDLLADTELLTSVLTYHVVEGEVMAESLVALIAAEEDGSVEVETLNGATISVAMGENAPIINDVATVFLTDVEASNGVIHAIDTVLLPPADDMMEEDMSEGEEMEATEEAMDESAEMEATEEAMDESADMEATEEAMDESADMEATEEDMTELGTLVDVASADENFSTLVAAVAEAGLVETLSGEDEFTVFAPTNEAFEEALEALGLTAEELLADTDTLTTILTYHVVPGTVVSVDARALELPAEVETVQGEAITIGLNAEEGLMVNEATIVATDVMASNGVIHIIDAVILPPSMMMADEDMSEGEEMEATEEAMDASEDMAEMGTLVDVAAADEQFSTLVAAVEAAGLVETLSGEDAFTVFAPTDEAFEAALEALGLTAEELLADTDTLTTILTYHVVPGTVLAEDVLALELPAEVETVQGEVITVSLNDEEGVMVNAANVTATDVMASNGVIHVIDAVILPPSMTESDDS